MTVGVTISNSRTGRAMTDKEGSGSLRKSHSYEKLRKFDGPNYHGLVCGSGNADAILGAYESLTNIEAETLDKFLRSLADGMEERDKRHRRQWLDRQKALVNDKASIIDDESERQLFVRSENIRTNARFDEQMSGSPILAVVAYDTERKRVFQYGVGCGIVYESHDPSNPIGSGADAAGLRMIRKLPGVNVDRLTSADMLFFLTTAFCESTTNVGVGGSPSSGEVDKDGARIVDHKVCIAVSNVCGSYLADECSRLTLRKTRQLVKGIGKGDKKAISEAATLLDMSEDRLQNMYVLPSTWTEMANRKLYC